MFLIIAALYHSVLQVEITSNYVTLIPSHIKNPAPDRILNPVMHRCFPVFGSQRAVLYG